MLKLNGHVVNVTKFPDGTSQVWKLSEELLVSCELCDKYRVTWIFENEGELFQIFQLLNFLGEKFHYKGKKIFDPHISVNALLSVCDQLDVRS